MPRRAWILWLMLAVLPLRGFAAGWMPTQQAAAQVAAAAATLPPCHGQGSDGPSACCNLCDLCHGASAAAPEVGVPVLPAPCMAPRPLPVHDTGRLVPDRLERPPRIASS